MSALADFAHKFGSESRELKIGQSFFNDADSCFHTIRYDFVPASVDPNKTSVVDFGSNGKVTVTMPNLEGSGTGRESVYQGMRKPHQKECVLIFNPETGELVLEKLNTSMIVKKARLRQEDMAGKSLAINNHKTATLPNGSSTSGSSSSVHSIGQTKSSIHNEKAKSSTLKSTMMGQSMPNVAAKLPNKTSPPLTSTGLTVLRTNGFQAKTPSPPSMPIFSANKGSLLHTNGAPPPPPPLTSKPSESSNSGLEWNGGAKSKEPTSISVPKLGHKNGANHPLSNRRLSEESSSDSDANSDDDEDSESSSQSSDSGSDDDKRRPAASSEISSASKLQQSSASQLNALSMPSFLSGMSMPSSLVARAPSGLDSSSPNLQHSSSSSNHAKSPPETSKKPLPALPSSSALSLSLSEDSDSSDDDEHTSSRHQRKQMNGKDMPHNRKKDLAQGGSPPMETMPKFPTNNGSAPSAPSSFPSMPKVAYSQLSQDLQLSESGSDSDD